MTKEEKKAYDKEYYKKNKKSILENTKKYSKEHKVKKKEYHKKYNEEHKDEIKEYHKNHYEVNKEEIQAKHKIYRDNNKDKLKEYREINSERLAKYQKEYRKKNKDKIKEYREINSERESERQKEYYRNNKVKIKEKNRRLYHRRMKTDALFKIKESIRGGIRDSFRRTPYSKKSNTYKILDCSFEEFKEYIEEQFEPWMTWDNYGNPKDGIIEENKTWDLDHIIPVSSATTEEELLKLNHFSNFQPLCSYINRYVKRDNVDWSSEEV